MSRWTRPAWAALLIYMQALHLAFRVGGLNSKAAPTPLVLENTCHVVQTEQRRYPIHGKLVKGVTQ